MEQQNSALHTGRFDIPTCCFSGYRPHRFNFSPDGLRPEQIVQALERQIGILYGEGYRRFISGMCMGVDLWAASAVAALRQRDPSVELIGAVPFAGQESRWTAAWQREYARLTKACTRLEIISTPEQAAGNPADCYRRRNYWMVDHADTVLAVYDPRKSEQRSGTAATVRYARKCLRRIVYIDPVTLQTAEETVYQINFNME